MQYYIFWLIRLSDFSKCITSINFCFIILYILFTKRLYKYIFWGVISINLVILISLGYRNCSQLLIVVSNFTRSNNFAYALWERVQGLLLRRHLRKPSRALRFLEASNALQIGWAARNAHMRDGKFSTVARLPGLWRHAATNCRPLRAH